MWTCAGRKRWFLSEHLPDGGYNPKQNVRQWVATHYPRLLEANGGKPPPGFYDCTTGPGDILYLPAQWYRVSSSVRPARERWRTVPYCA